VFKRKTIKELDDFFVPLSQREEKGIYFYRIAGYNDTIGKFLRQYYETARQQGVIIEGRIANPDENNLSYYYEIMGMEFQNSMEFIMTHLKKWMPRMSDFAVDTVATAMYDTLCRLQEKGKNENMLKNAYVKFMCWLYYKFERIANQLGAEQIPKILYEGEVSKYELLFLSLLCSAGCDVVLLEITGDSAYQQLDQTSEFSDLLQVPDMGAFSASYGIKTIVRDMQEEIERQRLYGTMPQLINCTNAWIEGKGLDDIQKPPVLRGEDEKLFYNCFCRINGVEDKLTYANTLFQFQLELKNSGRKVVIVDGEIALPSVEEIAEIKRRQYTKQNQMLLDLANNIQSGLDTELQCLMRKAFLDVMLAEGKKSDENVNKLMNKAVYLLCWLKRYQTLLFTDWKQPDIGCFIHFGGCKNENEALFFKMLARLPVDVLILKPNLNETCCLEDELLYEINDMETLSIQAYPQENADLHIGTVAYHAERDLDTLLYEDTGMYRNQQYSKANAITLKTMYEEINLLWREPLSYRPNFSTVGDTVNMPVIFSKVSGVKQGDVKQYWRDIKTLLTEDTFFITEAPYLQSTDPNPIKAYVVGFYKNGRLNRTKIKEHPSYPYGFLREEIQDYILDKLELLIEQRFIKGTFENGTEYTIIATVLNLPKDIVRMLQKFDFTKENPKLVYVNTKEEMISLEDTILVTFLNLIGFDVVFFVPTGYQTVERYFNGKSIEEHQIGEYMYDLRVPNMAMISLSGKTKWRDKIFKRGV